MLPWIILSLIAAASSTADPVETFGRALGLRLRDSRLEHVESVLGHQTAPPDEGPFVCYVAPRRDVLLRFLLDDLGSSERRIPGFTMRELSGAAAAPCSVLEKDAEDRADLSVGGLRLGMSRSVVKEILGPGFESDEGSLFRQFTRPDRDIVISARFRGGKLAELSVMAGWRGDPAMR
jgi:hypothetical protein